jgi:hypothetical protein
VTSASTTTSSKVSFLCALIGSEDPTDD